MSHRSKIICLPILKGEKVPEPQEDIVLSHHVMLTHSWKKMKAMQKIEDAKVKSIKLFNNPDFPQPWSAVFLQYSVFLAHIADAEKKLQARLMNKSGSAKKLKVSLKTLYKNCQSIGIMVQLKMKKVKPDEAIRICNNAGYTWHVVKPRGKRKNQVKPTSEPGTVKAYGTGRGHRDWQMSHDAGVTAVDLLSTKSGIKTQSGLVSKNDIWFRWRLILANEERGPWSEWFKGRVP